MTVIGENIVYLDSGYAREPDRKAIGMELLFALEHIPIREAKAAAER